MRSSSTVPLLVAGLLGLTSPVLAQSPLDGGLRGPITPDAPAAAARRDAPALPGLAARRTPAPIPAEPGQNLGPNDALFDAIDRGDLGAARDAMARGADLNARNALGLTPLESSVDQSRSEITFFLLSNRPMVVGAPPPAPASSAAARNVPLAAPSPQMMPGRAAAAPRPAPQAVAPARAADGGTPRPDKGFLGFDAGRPSGG
ncbi:ankyrin repeat domain-containing protein [Teichococcus oryzae]|uniref:Ankyrin repeat domain-containing protein n=1 Tax=Teichococcus oryzae TaxID=1608942 RepID=A0A5B2TGX2_9PROT|nr:ankyrin repeat domain-containing protein [Pseudoroseomonas oryzae]KAA2213439.1 ankyrin repeat domain-containing protein [Pseudoroseomonas oryzae]